MASSEGVVKGSIPQDIERACASAANCLCWLQDASQRATAAYVVGGYCCRELYATTFQKYQPAEQCPATCTARQFINCIVACLLLKGGHHKLFWISNTRLCCAREGDGRVV